MKGARPPVHWQISDALVVAVLAVNVYKNVYTETTTVDEDDAINGFDNPERSAIETLDQRVALTHAYFLVATLTSSR